MASSLIETSVSSHSACKFQFPVVFRRTRALLTSNIGTYDSWIKSRSSSSTEACRIPVVCRLVLVHVEAQYFLKTVEKTYIFSPSPTYATVNYCTPNYRGNSLSPSRSVLLPFHNTEPDLRRTGPQQTASV